MKKVVISCGPIPARLDSVKFITNRFKGGLAFKTANYLIERNYDVTIVTWKNTDIPANIQEGEHVHLEKVTDVFDYYNWYKENAADYDAFIMAAAVANLTPSNPYEGKFPSHNYSVGEKFNIQFEIAPRAIDIVKKVNPRCCLIGYKLFDTPDENELAEIARHTLADARANIVFANTPQTAKSRKIAVMADNAVLPCSFDEHLELIQRAIEAEYYRTEIVTLSETMKNDPHIRQALATVRMYEKTFPHFGTVAVPVLDDIGAFATTSRGHSGEPVIVTGVDHNARIIYASGKATLNAATLEAALSRTKYNSVIIHRHDDDPLIRKETCKISSDRYLFAGTVEEVDFVRENLSAENTSLRFLGHGDLRAHKIIPVDWKRYYELFPAKYFSIPNVMKHTIENCVSSETLEVGGNARVDTKYALDAFVKAGNAENICWSDVEKMHFDLVAAKNSINYLTLYEIKMLIEHTNQMVANTFLLPPTEKICENEASVLDTETKQILHTLRLPDNPIMRHSFYAYTRDDYESVGLIVTPYGKNSALLTKQPIPSITSK